MLHLIHNSENHVIITLKKNEGKKWNYANVGIIFKFVIRTIMQKACYIYNNSKKCKFRKYEIV